MKKLSIKEARDFLQEKDVRMFKYRNALLEVPFDNILYMIEPSNLAQKFVDFYNAFPAFREVPAGAKHHHWWKGGLEEHCKEMIGIGFDLMELYPGDLNKFTKSDLIIAIFLHDFAKVQMYIPITPEDRKKAPDKYLKQQEFKYTKGKFNILDHESWTIVQLSNHGVPVTEHQWSAVVFGEGGYADANFGYNGRTRTADTVMSSNPLAVFISMLDAYSSQILGKSLFGMPEEVEIVAGAIKEEEEDS